jgi:phosphohistidine phosphatase
MELLLVRHAIAFERNAKRWPDDAERPLSPRGAARARKAAAGLKVIARRPARVLASPLRRTLETAAILTEHAAWPGAVECPELLPGATPEALLSLLRRMPDKCIALVGHEPGLGRLIGACLTSSARGRTFELKKLGAALLKFPGAARPGGAQLVWMARPRMLRALAG